MPSTLPVARTIRLPRAVTVPSMVPPISASSTSTAPLKTPPWVMDTSVACSRVASTKPSTTRRSASWMVPWTLMPRPTTKVRRSVGSRGAGRAGGIAGRGTVPLAGGGFEAGWGKGGRDMGVASLGGAGRKGGTPRPLSRIPSWGAGTAWRGARTASVEDSPTPAGIVLPGWVGGVSSRLRRLNNGTPSG